MNEHGSPNGFLQPGTLFYRVFHDSPVGMAIASTADGTYVDVNAAFAHLVGYGREQLLNQPFTSGLPEFAGDREMILQVLREARRVADVPFIISRRDGSMRTCVASIQIEEIDGDEYFFAAVQDFTEQKDVQRALKVSENRFKLFFSSVPLPLLVIDDVTFRILDVNPAASQLYGYSRDEFLSLSLNDLIPPDGPSVGRASDGRAQPPGQGKSGVGRQRLKDGSIIEANVTSVSFNLDGRRASLSIVEDVTEQRALQAELEASEERLRIIADMTADAMWTMDLAANEMTWSAGFQAMFGYADEPDMDALWWFQRIHPDDQQAVAASMAGILRSDNDYWMAEFRFQRADGRYANVVDNGYIVRDKDGLPVRFMGSMTDLTEPLQLAEVSARAALEERQRLAHSLHNSVTQSLYSVSLLAEASHRHSESGHQEVMLEYLDRLRELTMQTLRQMRLLVYELRPNLLDQEGLAGALRHRLEAVEGRAGIKARLIDDTTQPIPPGLSSELLWIGQEALNNALSHSTATAVLVHLRAANDVVILEVRDNGKGFESSSLEATGGLAAIRRRVIELAGDMKVDAEPGGGAVLTVSIPLSGVQLSKKGAL